MSKYRFCIVKDRGPQPVLEMDLPDVNAIEAKSRELAQVLLEEARKAGRHVDFDVLRVSDDEGRIVSTGTLGELGNPTWRTAVAPIPPSSPNDGLANT